MAVVPLGSLVGCQDIIGHISLLALLVPDLPPLAPVIQDLGRYEEEFLGLGLQLALGWPCRSPHL